jgi:hypothetical protein
MPISTTMATHVGGLVVPFIILLPLHANCPGEPIPWGNGSRPSEKHHSSSNLVWGQTYVPALFGLAPNLQPAYAGFADVARGFIRRALLLNNQPSG